LPNQRHRRGGAGAHVNGFDAHGVGHLLRVTVPADVEFGWDAGGFEVGVSCHRVPIPAAGRQRWRRSAALGGCAYTGSNTTLRGLDATGAWTLAGGGRGARLLGSYSPLRVLVDGGGDVMDEPGVPSLVRLQVCGQRMAVWALLSGCVLLLGLFHGAAPPRRKRIRLS
jgi:hypothetical protein